MCDKNTERRTISLGFTKERVPEGQHICYLYNDDLEMRRVMAKFLESGLLAREKAFYLVDAMTPDEMLDSLEEQGVDARSQQANLIVSEALPTYCPHGTFDYVNMLDKLREFYLQAVDEEEYLGARAAGETSWCRVKDQANIASLLEYEARINTLKTKHPITTCCLYDTRLFDGSTIMDVLAVHPVMIVRGQLVKNPYYIEPDLFLREYHERASVQGV